MGAAPNDLRMGPRHSFPSSVSRIAAVVTTLTPIFPDTHSRSPCVVQPTGNQCEEPPGERSCASGGDPPPPALTPGSPDSQEEPTTFLPHQSHPYLSQPALHSGLGATLSQSWRPNGLDLQQAL